MPAVKEGFSIEHPHAGEIVTSPYYSFRVDAPRAARVRISIDGGLRRLCRYDQGCWRYDWAGYGSGAHEVRVHAENSDGVIVAVESRRVVVRLDESAAERRTR